jgi:hypothetical protein
MAGEYARPINPSQHYLVSGDGEGLRCSCPDFETHSEDPSCTCKHMLAVEDYQRKTATGHSPGDGYSSEERAAIKAEASAQIEPRNGKSENGESVPAQMLIKRSISPDARIDSMSIEFTSVVDDNTVAQIKTRALKTLKLQTEIVQNFLRTNGKAKWQDKCSSDKSEDHQRRRCRPPARCGRHERPVWPALLFKRRCEWPAGALLRKRGTDRRGTSRQRVRHSHPKSSHPARE